MEPGTLIVTGASRGIGAATAIRAAAAGWAVAVNYSASRAAADDVVARIAASGGRALAIAGDVADEADVANLFETAQTELGPVRGLVNNAGVLARQSPLADIELERYQTILGVNATGAFLCARQAVRTMSTARGGSGGVIVNVSSMAAVLGAANEFIDYAMSKGAVDALTIGLAREVGGEGIRVNGVRPGLIETEMHASSGLPDRAQRLSGTVPMGRVGASAEVADAIVYLLSDQASYITGAIVNVSGGR